MTQESADTATRRGTSGGSPLTGVAGRAGDDVRSDLRATARLTDSGGIRLTVRSRVGSLYGPAIEAETRRVAEALGVSNVEIEIDDAGAIDPVIGARVEAALRAAGVKGGDARPARRIDTGDPTDRDRLRRSRLYLPGDQPKLALNAGLHRPDGVILDLEDSVHPDHKAAARLVVRNLLRTVDFMGAERMVRINPLPLGLEDLDAVAPEAVDVILVPKVEDPETLLLVDERIRANTDRPVWLMPILETAVGVERAFEIASAVDSIVALTIGLEDYTADLGVAKTVEGSESLYARMRLVNAARAAARQPIDSVFGDVADEEGLRGWAVRSRSLGFDGMGCVHPRQIKPIHEAFAPSEADLARARRIVSAFEEAEERGLGVVSLGSKMIDPPVVRRALRTVEIARRTGRLEEVTDD
ncbi:MAG: aldolase/citrate lyase family protein [marine benthic group bacterium]|nr:aldolase/citrate lyase family protein [Gemmatimonadota bacterium]